jgi:hypothetical protein
MTKLKTAGMSCLLALGVGLVPNPASAKVPPEQAAQLGGDRYTCVGAEKAGTASGVAAFSGKWLDSWPEMKSKGGYDPGPYADEAPLFTITAQNAAQYADKLTEGQKALFKRYPESFRMNVYPSHRDFRVPDWVCEVAKKNAASAELVHEGLGTNGETGAIAFPFPQSGQEAVWNMILPYRAWNETAIYDIADVYGNGSIAWGRQRLRTLSLFDDPNKRSTAQDQISSYFYNEEFLPPRDKGAIGLGWQPNDFHNDRTQTWQYNPGTRRVRQSPEVGFDYPIPPAGLRTIDDDYLFQGNPERFEWKIVGKKEFYVPYNNFRSNDPAIKYSDFIKPNTVNPDYQRYELHRVWVVEAQRKPEYRHIYKKKVLYVDEDTWLSLWSEAYDNRDQVWRTAFIDYHYSAECECYHRGVSIYHDLTAGAYEATYLVNEVGPGNWWKLNDPANVPDLYSPKAAATAGH